MNYKTEMQPLPIYQVGFWKTEIQNEINSFKENIEGSGDYKSGFGDGMWTILNKLFQKDNNLFGQIHELRKLEMTQKLMRPTNDGSFNFWCPFCNCAHHIPKDWKGRILGSDTNKPTVMPFIITDTCTIEIIEGTVKNMETMEVLPMVEF